MDINDLISSGFQVLEPCDEDDCGGIDTIEGKLVNVNKDGMELYECDLTFFDSPVCIETVCDLFPEYDGVDINKGYYIMWQGKMIIE